MTIQCSTNSYAVGGTISGLIGSGLVLQDNASDDLTITAGATTFQFATKVADTAAYLVSIKSQPAGQLCSITGDRGPVAGSDINSVQIQCASSSYSVGGTVTGLVSGGLTIHDDNFGTLHLNSSGSFTFPGTVQSGTSYLVSIQLQPTGQTCTLSGEHGAVASADITSIAINCTSNDSCGGDFAGVSVPAGTIPVTDCQTISAPGNYVLGNDLSATLVPSHGDLGDCLVVQNTNNVRIDCAGHTISGAAALRINQVDSFEIVNCDLQAKVDYLPLSTVPTLVVTNSTHGAFDHSTLEYGQFQSKHVNHFHVFDNTIHSFYLDFHAFDTDIACNQFTSPYNTAWAVSTIIALYRGGRNICRNNTIDGAWDLGRGPPIDNVGSDDGIVIQDESDDIVEDNIIRNNWDTGVETLGVISNLQLLRNQIIGSGIAGFGGWYYSSISGSTFTGNTIDGAQKMFWFSRVYGLRPAGWDDEGGGAADTTVAFTNNIFDNNVLKNQYVYTQQQDASGIAWVYNDMGFQGQLGNVVGETAPTSGQYVLTNNTFKDNQFPLSNSAPPDFGSNAVVAGMIDDSGGNICPAPTQANYPLACASH